MRLMTQYAIDCEWHGWVTSAKSSPHVVKRDIHSFRLELDCAGTTASSPLLEMWSGRQVPPGQRAGCRRPVMAGGAM
jgi:hypothetical protein